MNHKEKLDYVLQNGQRHDLPVAGVTDPKNLQTNGQAKLRDALWLSIISFDATEELAAEFQKDVSPRTKFTGFAEMCDNEQINGFLESGVYVDLPDFPQALRDAVFYVMMSRPGERGIKLQTIPGAWIIKE